MKSNLIVTHLFRDKSQISLHALLLRAVRKYGKVKEKKIGKIDGKLAYANSIAIAILNKIP